MKLFIMQFSPPTMETRYKYDGLYGTTKVSIRPPLWSNDQSSWLQILRYRVRFPALPDFLRNSGSGTGSTQPRQYN
jgi:hypothetical protein